LKPGAKQVLVLQEQKMSDMAQWPQQTYRRYSVDMHVPDWDPALLSNFDAVTWVDNMVRAGNQSLLQYTNSHVGLCLWRTNTGRRHINMGERDLFGEVVAECHRRGIHPLAYFSVIFDNWAFEQHPDWRILPTDGYSQLNGRYGTVCPNSPYRDYVIACIREIAGNYDIDGMFFDMTFWPAVCYCPHCTARFWREAGTEPPHVVNWDDPTWRAFQAAREHWLLEFAQLLTDTVRQTRPGITVNHQFSTIFHNWTMGVPLELAQACDYVGGDFYGGPLQSSLACKVYDGLTRHKPFEFHTSRTRIYTDHVTVKPMEEIRTESFVATLHSAALMLVDYVNADGTLNPQVYDFLGRLSQQRAAYEPYLGGQLMADVAIYYDKASMYNPREQGLPITQLQAVDQCPHREAVVGAARILQEAHIPFNIVTNANLEQLARYRAVIVPNVLEMTATQAETFRQFVAAGGVLIASGPSSLDRCAPQGKRFLLEDVLGVQYAGTLGSSITYLTPRDESIKQAIWPQDHVSYAGSMLKVAPQADTHVLGVITLPFVTPEVGHAIGSHFAAIHSNPPALQPEGSPAVTLHPFGKGVAIWLAAPFEASAEHANCQLILNLLNRILPGPHQFQADAHPAVEVTLFSQLDQRRLLVGLLNMQRQLPQVPVPATVRVQEPPGHKINQITLVPDGKTISFTRTPDYVQFEVAPFTGIAMYVCQLE
jgi:hypothetical protein